MVQAVVRLAGAAALVVSIFMFAGCQDDMTVEPQLGTVEGNYEGSYRFLQIEGVSDTAVDRTLAAKVRFQKSAFAMSVAGASDEFAVFCDVEGEYQLKDDVVQIATIPLEYTRGVCDQTFGTGGSFNYKLQTASLNLVAEVSGTGDGGQPVRSIKKLSLRRVK